MPTQSLVIGRVERVTLTRPMQRVAMVPLSSALQHISLQMMLVLSVMHGWCSSTDSTLLCRSGHVRSCCCCAPIRAPACSQHKTS